LSAFAGISYFRCEDCKVRFSRFMGHFASRSLRGKYELYKDRAKDLFIAGLLLSIIVAALAWLIYHMGDG